jgi:hypothetical protein
LLQNGLFTIFFLVAVFKRPEIYVQFFFESFRELFTGRFWRWCKMLCINSITCHSPLTWIPVDT